MSGSFARRSGALLLLQGVLQGAALAQAASKPEALKSPEEQVAALVKEGKLVEAAEALRSMAQESSTPWELEHRAALLLQQAGRFDEARAMHNQLAQSDEPPLAQRQVAAIWVYTLAWRNELVAVSEGGGMALAAEAQAAKALENATVETHREIKKMLARTKSTRMALERTQGTLVRLVGADDPSVGELGKLLEAYDAQEDNSRWLLGAAKDARALQSAHESALGEWARGMAKVSKAAATVDAAIAKAGTSAKDAVKARKAVEGKALGVADGLQAVARGASATGRKLSALLEEANRRLGELRNVVEVADMMLAPAQ